MFVYDDKSCVLLHKNHHFSAHEGSKRMIVCHLFELNKMEKKKVTMVQCRSEEMIADYSSKTTQDILFTYQKKIIQGSKKEYFTKHRD